MSQQQRDDMTTCKTNWVNETPNALTRYAAAITKTPMKGVNGKNIKPAFAALFEAVMLTQPVLANNLAYLRPNITIDTLRMKLLAATTEGLLQRSAGKPYLYSIAA